MEGQRNDGLFNVLMRDPDLSGFLVKFGLAGPVVIMAWDRLATLALPLFLTLPVSVALILGYAGILAVLIARIIRSADRWQVESAMQSRRLLTGDGRRAATVASEEGDEQEGPRGPAPAVPLPSFHSAYFLLRLTDEVQSARRDGRPMTLVSLDVIVPGREQTREQVEKVGLDLAHIAANQVKTISHPLSVGPTEFVFSLPDTNLKDAKAFVSKVVQSLGDYWCHFGLAAYPTDATEPEGLFNYARQQCEDSRQDKKVRRIEDYRPAA